MAFWALARKFWYAPLLIGLVVFVLLQKLDLAGTKADLAVSQARVTDLTTANQTLDGALTQIRLQRIDNDAIALKVAAKVGVARTVETHTQTVIEKAVKNDPVVRYWADSALPSGVRDALRSDQGIAPAR